MKRVSTLILPLLVLAVYANAADEKNLLKPTNKADSWRMEQSDSGKGTVAADGDAIVFDVTAVSGTEWHVQAAMAGVDFVEGKEYTLSFQAKADKDRPVQVNAMIDVDDWHTVGLFETVDLTKEYKDASYTFKAETVNKEKKNRVTLILGQEKGKVWVKNLKLVQK